MAYISQNIEAMSGKIKKLLTLTIFLAFWTSQIAYAQYNSPNYRVEETIFGAGGELDTSSTNFKARATAGELGVGNSASASFQMFAGFNTTNDPMLEVVVSGGTFDLGYLDVDSVKATTATFAVRNYLSSGYVVSLGGSPPRNVSGGYTLAGMAAAGSSSPGTDQFGVNLAANNIAPIGPFGDAPEQLPDTTFGFGEPAADYGTSNLFKFVEHETIAQSSRSSGVTVYTLSMMANTSKNATAGYYTTDLFVNVTPTF